MFKRYNFRTAIKNAREQIHVVEAKLAILECPDIQCLQVNLEDLCSRAIQELLKDIPTGYSRADNGTDHVYIFQVKEVETIENLRVRMQNARENASDYSKINDECPRSTTLYVGRSKTLRARLRQHLGSNAKCVYSLHLQRWAKPVRARLSIAILPFKFDAELSLMHDLLVQSIEEGIWESLKPAFGRKGGK
jgi:hypothetical protein